MESNFNGKNSNNENTRNFNLFFQDISRWLMYLSWEVIEINYSIYIYIR